MPVYCDWFDEAHAIIISRFVGEWTIEESIPTIAQFNALAMSISGRFDVIADFLQAAYTPPIGLLWEWKQTVAQRHLTYPNWRFTVIVSKSSVLDAYITEGIHTTDAIQKHYQLAKSIDEAVRIIQTDRDANHS